MFTIQLNNQPFRVYFQHDNCDIQYREPRMYKKGRYKGATKCTLFDMTTKAFVLDAIVFCSKKDRFVKSEGRRLALQRMVKSLDATKEEKKMIYTAYFDMCKPHTTN